MRSLRYLNTVLTVIAILLTLNLYTLWTATPGGALLDHAQVAEAQGVSNAGAQRKEMVDLLKQINTHLSDVKSTLKSGVTIKGDANSD